MTDLLQPALDARKTEMMKTAPDDVKEVMMDAARKLAASGLVENARRAGDTAPDFTLQGVDGAPVSLAELLANGPAVLVFYRGVWCPFCSLQFKALQEKLPQIEAAGATLVGISPSTPDNSLSMAEKHRLGFRVLSDVGNRVARRYGLVYTLDERLRPLYEGFGIDIPATNGDDSYELPLAATYVVDKRGIIRGAFLDADYTKRMEPTDIVKTLAELAKPACGCGCA